MPHGDRKIGAMNHEKAPTTVILIEQRKVKALMDTGAEISCIRPDTARKLRLQIDSSQSIRYSDVNGKSNQTQGIVRGISMGYRNQVPCGPQIAAPSLDWVGLE